jgi:hypothetical protein
MAKSEYKKSAIKTKRQKQLFIDQLQKTPIIQLVCEKLEIGRTSYYRWRGSDKKFATECDKAIASGQYLINDLAESMLVNAIKDCNLSAIRFWLQSHHESYKNKVELTGTIKTACEELTKEQEALVKRALQNAGLLTEGDKSEKEK